MSMPRTKPSKPDFSVYKAPNLAPPEEIAEAMALDGWGTPAHHAMEAIMRKYYRRKNDYHVGGVGSEGYWPDLNQKAIRIVMDQNKAFQSQLGAMDFIPFIKDMEIRIRSRDTNENRNVEKVLVGKPFSIFESTLSAGGSFQALVCPDASYVLVARWSSTFDVVYKATGPYHVADLLRYIYVNHPYQWRDNPGEDAELFSRLEALLAAWEHNGHVGYRELRKAMYPNLQPDADEL